MPVEVRRSVRRRRTVSAQLHNGTAVVSIPAHFTAVQEREWVERMLAKLRVKYGARYRPGITGPGAGEEGAAGSGAGAGSIELQDRARTLSEQYLDGRGQPQSIRWVTNQNTRWGSATPARRSIRLSHKLRGMPAWVVDYVLLHEMAHLIEPSHNSRFWKLLQTYPRTETAKAFLDGAAFAAGSGLQTTD
jgi:predicted metal-dependent hydrolase